MSEPGKGSQTGSQTGAQTGGGTGGERGWSLSARAEGEGVRLELGLPDLGGRPVTAILSLDRTEARAFARALLAAAGDATERTFVGPHET
ncbi:conserved hypothetical protein [Methylorubrum populi BJ001]|jgi:hypothetical protein|uniref:Uncharacterized protein n=1 Tax=Methylorubrum populi (strain ATCC BAA-705 / NCIMB 13946 / BJ001) TaxID=441620 RepID=B1ZEC8_METPB|nr:hypothetical protein [Methylorubrum populi]ACB79613.1 conserved hypothetical protein [Methylorubrum populi BJ001]OAH38722.1 hypothetical protein AX289_10795 [Methylorubrum populi]PZP70444.1 MAG: hypothetical protein DI590_10155 [Methylorubrum populi]